MIKHILNWLLAPFKKYRKTLLYNKVSARLELEYAKQLEGRYELRKDINKFLRRLFNADGKSRYIPPSFKNREEVRLALQDKFGERLEQLNLKLEDFLK